MEIPPILPDSGTSAQPNSPPPKFTLGAFGLILWAIYATARVALYSPSFAPKSDLALVYAKLLGEIVGSLLLSALLGWTMWRASGRSIFTRNFTVAVVLTWAFFSLPALLPPRSGVSTEEGLRMTAASKAFTDHGTAAKRQCDETKAKLLSPSPFALASFDSEQTISTLRLHVNDFAKALADYRLYFDPACTALRREYVAQGVANSSIDAACRQYLATYGTRQVLAVEIAQYDFEGTRLMLDFLDFGSAHFGQWQKVDGSSKVTFADPAVSQAYDTLLARVDRARAKQTELREQYQRLTTKAP